jgi:putative Holliday junction resolvase
MTASTRDAVAVAQLIQDSVTVDVRMIDERLTTVSAHGVLRHAGKKQKQTRHVIDQVAAVLILQHALDTERSQGKLPGKLLGDIQD